MLLVKTYNFTDKNNNICSPFCFHSLSEAPVILDPNTGSSDLTISEQMTRSTKSEKVQPLPANPERLNCTQTFGSYGFTSGKHWWDVKVGGYWGVGVAARPNDQYASLKIWGIYMCVCTDILRELSSFDYVNIVLEDSFPQKVRVHLDYDKGIVTFFDLDKKTLVHTIRHTFTEPVFPYFRENSKILPAELSVVIKQPR